MTYLPQSGILSDNNTTTTPLSASATYTGTGEQNAYPEVGISCKSDASGTLYMDFSNDGTNWDTFPTNGFKVKSNIHEFHTAVKLNRYFRSRYINGATSQTTFRLYTYYGMNFRQPNAPLNQPLGLDSDSLLVRPTFPWLDISRKLQTGINTVKKFGRNISVGTTYTPICIGGNYQTPQSTNATPLRIAAGNTNDSSAGTGAREITLQGLDENFLSVTTTLTTNGTSASSQTAESFTRLFRAFVSKSGTYATQSQGSHAATITIQNLSATAVWGIIDATNFPKGQTEIGAFSVANGKTAHVFLTDVTADTGKSFDLIFFNRGNINETSAPYTAMRSNSVQIGLDGGNIGIFGNRNVPFGPFTGPCDVGFLAKTDVGTAEVSVEFEIFIIDE